MTEVAATPAITRRVFCKGSIAGAIVAGTGLSLTVQGAEVSEPAMIVFDARSLLATEFSHRWSATSGAGLLGFAGDIANAWFGQIRHNALTGSLIGGYTSGHALFVVERLARGSGMRLAWRRPVADPSPDGTWQWVLAPGAGVRMEAER